MKPPERIFESHARHKLRAVGNEYRRLERPREVEAHLGQDGERPFGKRPRDSASRAEQLLNFLSKSAAQSERNLLSPTPVPEFARVRSSAVNEDAQALVVRKRKPRAQSKSSAAGVSSQALGKIDNLLELIAETIADQARLSHPVHSPNQLSQQSATTSFISADSLASALVGTAEVFSSHYQLHELQFESEYVQPYQAPTTPLASHSLSDHRSLSQVYSDCMSDLDSWLGFEATQAGPELLGQDERSCLPAALPAILCETEAAPPTEPIKIVPRTGPDAASAAFARRSNSRYKRFLFNKNVLWKPRMMALPNGSRRERFVNGGELTKDVHGRVIEIRTADGTSVQVHYDNDGKPDSFIRLDERCQAHSLGERDQHGVVVRDPEGRVRAAGESMSVDPTGCVSVRRKDGQFWSLDLLRGVHIERRRITDRDGGAFMLTALFASDGFRMVTRFQSTATVESEAPFQNPKGFLGDDSAVGGSFRFYGRDGSLIEFECEESLLELKPARVLSPGSRAVEPTWGGFYQAGTAWESVQEYITNYLLA